MRRLKVLFSGFWILGLVVSGWGLLMFSSAARRGFGQVGVWQLERIEAARSWLQSFSSSSASFAEEAMRNAFVSDPFQGPMNGLLPALVWGLVPNADVVEVARLTNTLLICLTAWCLYSIGSRAGGSLAGLGAAVALLSVPRIWAAATTAGLTAPALFTMTFAALMMARARDRVVYLLPAVVALVVAFLTTQMALLLLLPWVYLTFFDRRPSNQRGLLRSRSLSVWGPLALPTAAMVMLIAFPPFRSDGLQGLLDYLKAFVSLPREPTLYFNELYAEHRLPWHASIVLTTVTVAPTVLVLTLSGLISASPFTDWIRSRFFGATVPNRGDRAVEALRLSWAMLLLTLLLPLLFGTTHSHGVDLLALCVPWCAIFAGVGLKQLMAVLAGRLQLLFSGRQWARVVTLAVLTTLAWGFFVFALNDTRKAYPEVESYYNWMVGGVTGATQIGLPRYPHGPTPPGFLAGLLEDGGETRLAIVPDDGSQWVIIERYRMHGLIPAELRPMPLQEAQVVVFRFDETDEEFYQQLPDFFGTARSLDAASLSWLWRDGLPLIGALGMPR